MSPTDSRLIFVDPSKVRKPDQLVEYERIFRDGVCPFCLDQREKYTQGTRLYDGEHLWMFENNWPYKNTRRHIMTVAREHAVYMEDLPDGFGNEWLKQLQSIERTDAYGLAAIEARFGFVMWTGASVAHFHTHLLIPKDSSKDTLEDGHTLGVKLWAGESWAVHENLEPHDLARVHLLVVTKEDTGKLNDLPDGAGDELIEHFQRIETEYEFTHGGFHCRIKNKDHKGPESTKLVFDILAPEDSVYDDDKKKIRMKISNNPEVDFKIST